MIILVMSFMAGTRKNSVGIRFGIQVQVGAGQAAQAVTVESDNSLPFIVITNECQWEESEGTLIKKETFGDQVCLCCVRVCVCARVRACMRVRELCAL